MAIGFIAVKNALIHALRSAGEIQVKSFQAVKKISEKESISSVVTEVDLESEQRIISILEKDFSQHNILSEECGLISKASEYTWVIDPLDGTSNYAAGLPWFGVLIALMKGHNPILAGAYLPASDSLYVAEEGKGAVLNGKILRMESREIKNTLVAFSTDFTRDEQYLQKGLDVYRYLVQHTRNVRSTNCLLDLLYVAEGRFGGCINMYTRIWDIAALYLIITEAGGLFKNLDSSDIEFRIDEDSASKNYPILAGNKTFMESLKAVF